MSFKNILIFAVLIPVLIGLTLAVFGITPASNFLLWVSIDLPLVISSVLFGYWIQKLDNEIKRMLNERS